VANLALVALHDSTDAREMGSAVYSKIGSVIEEPRHGAASSVLLS
jgi:hypothetical protein